MGKDETTTRSFVFLTMLASNIFLTLANRSFEYTINKTIFYRNHLLWWIIGASVLISVVVFWAPWVRDIFRLGPLNLREVAGCVLTALVS
ncbi:MAG: cation transporting ATPase C-terminal domain-containing protein [Lewinellaceae bacterium]|nr:cation transporting ATPase C-terminal domain-containing protein [Lewinellaceae bacterium]